MRDDLSFGHRYLCFTFAFKIRVFELMAQETSASKTSDQMIRLNVFPLFRTFLPLPPLFAPDTQAIFLHVSDRFLFQESRISAIVNVCLCCGNAKFRTGNINLLFCSSSGGNVKILSGNLTGFSVFPLPLLRKYVQKLGYTFAETKFPFGIFLNSFMKLTFGYFF